METVQGLVNAIELAKKDSSNRYPFTIGFSNWLNCFDNYSAKIYESKSSTNAGTFFECSRGIEINIKRGCGRSLLKKIGFGKGTCKKTAYENCFKELVEKIVTTDLTQMETSDLVPVETITSTKVCDKQSNVILEVDNQADESFTEISVSDINQRLASSEKCYDIIGDGYSIMNRWFPLKEVKIRQDSDEVFGINIPRALYEDKTSVNLLPLKGFLYGDLDIEFKLVVNAAPFHCGRLIMGVFFCSQGFVRNVTRIGNIRIEGDAQDGVGKLTLLDDTETNILSINGMLQRDHVIIDYSKSTTASILVKYKYNKPFVRLLDYEMNNTVNPGSIGATFCYLSGRVLSPLRTGNDQPKEINATLLYRFVKANLTGMTKIHNLTQMDVIKGGLAIVSEVGDLANTGLDFIETIERQLFRKGIRTNNRDKPSMLFNNVVAIPRPRLHFPNGTGLSDTTVMSVDCRTLTTHYEKGDGPKSYLEYARIPGVRARVDWTTNQQKGSVIWSETVEPCEAWANKSPISKGFFSDNINANLPIHVASNGMMNWGGTIVYEFDIVKTDFHKGLVLVAVNFGKGVDNSPTSCYEKIVDIQQTSRIKITVPYIYDTISRRLPNIPYWTTVPDIKCWENLCVPYSSQTVISIAVLNPLINIESVSQAVQVVVWKYGGKDFFLNSPTQVNNARTLLANRVSAVFPYTWKEDDDIFTTNKYQRWDWKNGEIVPIKTEKEVVVTRNLSPGSSVEIAAPLSSVTETSTKPTVIKAPREKKNKKFLLPSQYRVEGGNYWDGFNWLTKEQFFEKYRISHEGVTQMDGDCEDFSVGRKDAYRLKSGNDTDFKNLLRLPVCILANQDLSPKQNFFIPVLPLSPYLASIILSHRATKSHQFQINSMFRMWRGSLRYNIIITKTGSELMPIYVSYLPPSGSMIYGFQSKLANDRILNAEWDGKFDTIGVDDLKSSGNLTTMIIPKINNSEVVEVPFNLQVTWALMGQDSPVGQKAWRDIGNLTNGHLVIYSNEQITFDVFLSAGDDYEISAFCGLGDNYPNFQSILRRDDVRFKPGKHVFKDVTQMSLDFSELEIFSDENFSLLNFSPRNIPLKYFLTFGIAFLPYPLNDICKMYLLDRILSKGEQVLDELGSLTPLAVDLMKDTKVLVEDCQQTCGVITNSVCEGREYLRDLTQGEGILDNIKEYLVDLFPWALELLPENIVTILTEALYCILNGNVAQYFSSLLSICYELGIFSFDWVTRYSEKVVELSRKIFGTTTQMDNGMLEEHGEMYLLEDDWKSLSGLIFGGLLTSFGVISAGKWQKGYMWFFSDFCDLMLFGKGLSTLNGAMTFMRNSFGLLKRGIEMICGIESEEARIRTLLAGKSEVLENFIKRAQEFLNSFNDSTLGLPVDKAKHWLTICNAYQLQACLCKMHGLPASHALSNLCKEVIKKANDNISYFQANVVRYEPFVLCLEGPPGIGKSFITTSLAVEILDDLGIKSRSLDIAYTVNPGVAYWNLFNNQPIIIYDDWANFTDGVSATKEFGELLQLKTSNAMNAPKAELGEKKMMVNPFAVILATNNPYPVFNTIHSIDAVYRRRDMVVSCRKKEGIAHSANFDHMEFAINSNVLKDDVNKEWLSYAQFIVLFRARHMEYHLRESANVKNRISTLSGCLADAALISDNIYDPFTLQAQAISLMEKKIPIYGLPSDELEHQVTEMLLMLKEDFKCVTFTDDHLVIGGKYKSKHLYEVGDICQWSVSEIFEDYFKIPIINTYKKLTEYLEKWKLYGLRCSSCSSTCSDGWILKKCPGCSKNFCSRCCNLDEGTVKCLDCDLVLELVGLPLLDILTGYLLWGSWEVFGLSQLSTMLVAFFKSYTTYDLLVPAMVVKFLNFMLKMKRTAGAKSDVTQGPTKVNKVHQKKKQEKPSLADLLFEEESTPIEVDVSIIQHDIKKYETGLLTAEEVKEADKEPLKNAYERDYTLRVPELDLLHRIVKRKKKNHGKLSIHCEHNLLLNSGAIFKNGKWYLTTFASDFEASPLICPHNCYFSNPNNLHVFLQEDFALHHKQYQYHFNMYKKGTLNRNTLESSVPYLYFPDWYMTTFYDKEINEITGGFWWQSLKVGGVMAAIVTGLWCSFKVTRALFRMVKNLLFSLFGWEDKTQLGLVSSGSEPRFRLRDLNRQVRKNGLVQSDLNSKSSEFYENMKDKICSNYVVLNVVGKKTNMIGLGLYNSVILIPKHYLHAIEGNEMLRITFFSTKHEVLEVPIENLKFRYFVNKDCLLLIVSRACYFKDIRHFVVQRDQRERNFLTTGEMIIPNLKENFYEERDIRVTGYQDTYSAYDLLSQQHFLSEGVIEYDFERSGVCGSIILNSNSSRPIVGMHIAGNNSEKYGIGLLLDAGMFEDTISLDLAPLPYVLGTKCLDFGEEVNVEYLGSIDPLLIPHQSSKTAILPSLVDKYFDEKHLVEPAILSGKDERYLYKESPLLLGVKKHGKPTLDFPNVLVEECYDFWKLFLLKEKFVFDQSVKVYSMRDATLGKPKIVDYYDYLPDDTSAGWPFNVTKKIVDGVVVLASKKKHWIRYIKNEQEQPIDVEFDKELLHVFNSEMDYRRRGLLAPIVFQDVLKDEKRDINKLLRPGGTRVFSMSPVTASIAMRMYTLDLTSYLRMNRITNWIAIGIAPDGAEWAKLANRLLRFRTSTVEENIFSIDFTNFGPGLNIEVSLKFKDLIIDFFDRFGTSLGTEDSNIVNSLIYELLTSVHLASSTLYRTKSGSPSGAAITVEMNSFTHLMYITLCWKIMAKIISGMLEGQSRYTKKYVEVVEYLKKEGINLSGFRRMGNMEEFIGNVIGAVYGDDGIFAVNEQYRDVFNAQVIHLILLKHGIAATDASKKEVIMKYGLLKDVSFLKRSFVPHPKWKGMFLAPIDEVSIIECARWIHKSSDNKLMTMENVNASLLLAYGQGEDWFKAWKNRLNDYLIKEELPPRFLTWMDIDEIFFSDLYPGFEKSFEQDEFRHFLVQHKETRE